MSGKRLSVTVQCPGEWFKALHWRIFMQTVISSKTFAASPQPPCPLLSGAGAKEKPPLMRGQGFPGRAAVPPPSFCSSVITGSLFCYLKFPSGNEGELGLLKGPRTEKAKSKVKREGKHCCFLTVTLLLFRRSGPKAQDPGSVHKVRLPSTRHQGGSKKQLCP